MNGEIHDSWETQAGTWGPGWWETYGSQYQILEPTPWYENWWETTKDVAAGLSGFGLKAFQTYQAGKQQVYADNQALAFQLPQGQPPEKQSYIMQSGQPAPAQASRITLAGAGTAGGINMNMILIGAAILGAAFFLKGK